ncbi:hypothetical protein AYI70_g8371 [Smittium culicis]|uniref:Uncharacterized protein n=1 Tax=Smittium culicis TaxID=133412 RepID=A0A1R1XG79_9FUNG|nr:hypothetical protein AYI70_g8371 [Smittium culicis]
MEPISQSTNTCYIPATWKKRNLQDIQVETTKCLDKHFPEKLSRTIRVNSTTSIRLAEETIIIGGAVKLGGEVAQNGTKLAITATLELSNETEASIPIFRNLSGTKVPTRVISRGFRVDRREIVNLDLNGKCEYYQRPTTCTSLRTTDHHKRENYFEKIKILKNAENVPPKLGGNTCYRFAGMSETKFQEKLKIFSKILVPIVQSHTPPVIPRRLSNRLSQWLIVILKNGYKIPFTKQLSPTPKKMYNLPMTYHHAIGLMIQKYLDLGTIRVGSDTNRTFF